MNVSIGIMTIWGFDLALFALADGTWYQHRHMSLILSC
jgi:hypothetical protein